MPSVAIVVLNWNGFEDTEKCINSLLFQTHNDFSIVVVDNGSIDESLVKLKRLEMTYDKLTVIANRTNKGFAGGVNTGIKYALEKGFDSVALFNNDAIADKDWLLNLDKEMGRDDVSVVTGLLLSRDGKKIDSTSEQYSVWGMPFPRSRGISTAHAPASGFVFGATGGATLYDSGLFKEIGLFDESFFAYYEDVDISFRTQLAGHKVYFTNQAIAYHKQGATSSKIPGFTVYQTFKNIPLLYAKNVPVGLLLPIGARLLLLYVLFFGNAVKNGVGIPALKGWFASVRYFWTRSIWLRSTIQRNKKVSTSYINSIIFHDLSPVQTRMRKFRKLFTGKT